jgi:hypothetical protein
VTTNQACSKLTVIINAYSNRQINTTLYNAETPCKKADTRHCVHAHNHNEFGKQPLLL